MTVSGRSVWQISAGPANASFAEVFLQHGVALVAPGDAGPWRSDRSDEEFDGGLVRRFATEIAIGDVFLLRSGLATVVAVGIVASDYFYANAFDDVHGLDLQHARRVRWRRLPEAVHVSRSRFRWKPTSLFESLVPEVVDFAVRFANSPPTSWQTAALPELPAEEPPIDHVPDALQGLVAQAADLLPLYQHDASFGEPPSEDELIVHFVVPFLRALGWPPERIAVKWRYVDVAVFRALPRSPENCLFVIEAKRLGAGIEAALAQAAGYVEALGIPRDVIVTDGIRYRMYAAEHGFEPLAYANLARLKKPAGDLFSRDAETVGGTGMEPWYKVATPRKEVREGRSFNPDEFAIALEQVVAGTAPRGLPRSRTSSSRAPASRGRSASTRQWSCAGFLARPKTPRRCSRSSRSSAAARRIR